MLYLRCDESQRRQRHREHGKLRQVEVEELLRVRPLEMEEGLAQRVLDLVSQSEEDHLGVDKHLVSLAGAESGFLGYLYM